MSQLEEQINAMFPQTRGMNPDERVTAVMAAGGPLNCGSGSHRVTFFFNFVGNHWGELSEYNKRQLRENYNVVETKTPVRIYLT